MSETKTEIIQEEIVGTVDTNVETVEKPYTFRLLGADDIFLMAKIIKTIGIKEFKVCFESKGITSLIQNAFMDAKKKAEETGEESETNIISVGVGVALEAADVILCNLDKCRDDIYQLLSQTSNLTVDEIRAPGNAVMFFEMVIDFFKKEEFRDFFGVVSRLF